ncbi:MAG: long-chain-fatty-acid--CoA ligase [Solirubrobacteraceae bacterium]
MNVKGLMQDVPLTLDLVLRRARTLGQTTEVVSVTPAGVVRHRWSGLAERAERVAGVLHQLGVPSGGRVATFALNGHRHVELHLGVPAAGRVLHPVNLRLSDEHVSYLVEHAGDEVAFIDASLTGQIAPLKSQLGLREWVVMEDGGDTDPAFADCPRYEQLLARSAPDDATRSPLAEDDAAWICSTSGTTGKPKLVVTSHRSVYLHTLGALMVDSHAVSRGETVIAATPMFHVAAWGTPYSCAYAPAKLVLPGKDTSPEALAGLIESERVTLGFGVPTIWIGLERAYEAGERDLSSLRMIQCGGASSTRALIDRYARRGVQFVQSWGMTEMSPCGTSMRVPADDGSDRDAVTVAKVGVASPGVELRLVDEDGAELPWDGQAVGEIQARGPWVIRAYLDPEDDANETRFDHGWLSTGDLARIELDGTVEIVDRLKDLIKSGGEWISSLDLERELAAHPRVSEAIVVAVPDPRWGERPAAVIVTTTGAPIDAGELRDFLRSRVARWWIPDRFEFVSEIPRTGVGKYDKQAVRRELARTPTE